RRKISVPSIIIIFKHVSSVIAVIAVIAVITVPIVILKHIIIIVNHEHIIVVCVFTDVVCVFTTVIDIINVIIIIFGILYKHILRYMVFILLILFCKCVFFIVYSSKYVLTQSYKSFQI